MDDVEGDAPLVWGGPRGLTSFETLMSRADGDLMTRSTVMAVEVLDTRPDWHRLLGAHGWAVRTVRRFRDRVIDRLGPFAIPVWRQDVRALIADVDLVAVDPKGPVRVLH
jgi:diacylglycerol O-acyltransferase / wax synthase